MLIYGTGGHLKPDPYSRAAEALNKHGKEAAEEVASFESRHLKAIADLVKKEDIDFLVREIERLRQQSSHHAGRYPKAASRLRLHPASVTQAGRSKRLAPRSRSHRDSARRLSSSRDLEQPLNRLLTSSGQNRSVLWSPMVHPAWSFLFGLTAPKA